MAAAEAPRSSSSGDSYIGSLISLTSKSEIRYEGVLYHINTEESNIGLKNVISFGTEGRKKDGPQVAPSDKVYEYILFRGSDIKDLQVKSSPPVNTTQPINNDPAIIQSHYPHPTSTTTTMPSAAPGPSTDASSHTTQLGLPGSNFQSNLPLYHPGGNLGPWGPSPPQPGPNGSGPAMPMYWQGFYGPPNGMPNFNQQSLLRPPQGLSMPPSMQQPMQYPSFNTSFSTGASNFPNSNLPEYPSHFLNNSVNIPTSSTLPSTLPPAPSTLASELLANSMQTKVPISAPISATVPSLASLTTSGQDINVSVPPPPISSKPNASSGMNFLYQSVAHPSPFLGTSKLSVTEMSAAPPSLVTPGQLLQSGSSSSQALQTAQKDVEVVQVSSSLSSEPSAPPAPLASEAQSPILPLPTPSRAVQKMNGSPNQARHGYRGRGRGIGGSRPVMKFTEEFDFMAMNEKFNKDEVWGDLGKSNKSHLRDIEGDRNNSYENDYESEDDAESSVKTVYNKDDFFDTLSCNALDRDSNNGRTRFSEQMKIDTETFGEFSRYRGGRGGRGYNRGGRGGFNRGGYYGGRNNNNGYMGRGRGRGYNN